jgi:hypothetical protein
MALMQDGDVIVSDNDGGGVYRIRADVKNAHMERVDGGQFISPQTPAAAPDGQHVFVPDYVGGVGVLDVRTEEVRWIEANKRHAMQGIDGLYFAQGTLLATQNGTSPERVVFFSSCCRTSGGRFREDHRALGCGRRGSHARRGHWPGFLLHREFGMEFVGR